MRTKSLMCGVFILAGATGAGLAQDTVTIPKAEYEKIKSQQAETDQAIDELDKKINSVKAMAKDSYPGETKFLLTGYGSASYADQNNGGGNGFSAQFNPIFLWKMSDRLFFEGEFEAELEGSETAFKLEIAQLSYLLNDYMTIGAGKFLNPVNYFVERQHSGWINKLPDKPLAVYDGLFPESNVGVQLRGGVPVGSTKFGYALYAANSPILKADASSVDATELGTLEYDNFDNVGNNIAVGGRVGFLPLPELEIGYGVQASSVSTEDDSASADNLLQSVDFSYVRDSAAIAGIINLKAQWVWSKIDDMTYDAAGDAGGPFTFDNKRDGGYGQISYRPSRAGNEIVKNLEAVYRYDILNQDKTPTGVDERRNTIGLNYWLGPSSVFKVAYAFDHQTGEEADAHDSLMLQLVTGF